MKNLTLSVAIVLGFVLSMVLNMLVLERGGALVNHLLIYGFTGHFSLNGTLALLAGGVGICGVWGGYVAGTLLPSTAVVQRHLAMASLCLFGTASWVLLMMLFLPVVKFR